jgi:hypothetical protein
MLLGSGLPAFLAVLSFAVFSHQSGSHEISTPVSREVLNEKFANLKNRFLKRPLIILSKESSFNEFLVHRPRNYSAFVLFTLPSTQQRRCLSCENARTILDTIAVQYTFQGGFLKKPVFFFEISAQRIVGLTDKLGVISFPSLLYFPEDGRLQNVKMVDSSELVFRHEHRVAAYVENAAGIKLNYRHTDGDYSSMVLRLLLVMVLGFGAYKQRDVLMQKFRNISESSAYYCLVVVILLVSGHVYNYVAMPIPIGSDANGLVWVAATRRYQFQVEAYIISVLYFLYSIGFIFVVEARRNLLEKKGNSSSLALCGFMMASGSHLLWMVICRIKGG